MTVLGIILSFLFLLFVLVLGTSLLVFKILEQITNGRFKFFDRRLNEPIYQKNPRPVSFF